MLSVFNLEKLQTLLKDFYRLTGMRITIFNDSFEELTSYPESIAPVCRFIRRNPEAKAACHDCDRKACRTALQRRKSYIYRCHAGLTEAVAPVFIGNLPAAYLLFGHLFSYPSQYIGWVTIRTCCKKYGLDEEKLKTLVISLPMTEKEKILAAADILQAVASYLCYDQMISLRRKTMTVRIDEYIEKNMRSRLDTAVLCEEFQIGKTTLCKIARDNYGEGIAEHIRNLRIRHAEQLLTDSRELSVAEIAEKCGFSDYNYFITVFRKSTGMPPGEYRNQKKPHLTGDKEA